MRPAAVLFDCDGVLVDSDDPALIADAAARILSLSDDDWKKMSDAALAAASTHDWDASYAKFEVALLAAAKSAGKSSG